MLVLVQDGTSQNLGIQLDVWDGTSHSAARKTATQRTYGTFISIRPSLVNLFEAAKSVVYLLSGIQEIDTKMFCRLFMYQYGPLTFHAHIYKEMQIPNHKP